MNADELDDLVANYEGKVGSSQSDLKEREILHAILAKQPMVRVCPVLGCKSTRLIPYQWILSWKHNCMQIIPLQCEHEHVFWPVSKAPVDAKTLSQNANICCNLYLLPNFLGPALNKAYQDALLANMQVNLQNHMKDVTTFSLELAARRAILQTRIPELDEKEIPRDKNKNKKKQQQKQPALEPIKGSLAKPKGEPIKK